MRYNHFTMLPENAFQKRLGGYAPATLEGGGGGGGGGGGKGIPGGGGGGGGKGGAVSTGKNAATGGGKGAVASQGKKAVTGGGKGSAQGGGKGGTKGGGKGGTKGGGKGGVAGKAGLGAAGNKLGGALGSLGTASLVGGGLSALGSLAGSYLQSDAAKQAAQTNQNMFNTLVNQQAPYRAAGQSALSNLNDLLGTSGNTSAQGYGSLTTPFTSASLNANMAPNYAFQLQQGQNALNAQNNALGGLVSGNALQATQNYAQNYAQNAYQNAFNNYQSQNQNIYNRLGNIASLGQGAASNQAVGGTTFGSNIGGAQQAAGTAMGGGLVGGANALGGGYQNYTLANVLQAAGTPTTGA